MHLTGQSWAGLSQLIPVQQGVRHGRPLSGQLYSLAIEPLLCRLRDWLCALSLPVGFSVDQDLFTLSVYTDDAFVFVTSQGAVQCTYTKGPHLHR